MKNHPFLKALWGAVLAGMAIALGGAVFLSVDNKVTGALLFTVGLFAVCVFGFNLFTGKMCYCLEGDRSYRMQLPVIWLGNLAGAVLVALLLSLTRSGQALYERAQGLIAAKLSDGLWSLFILGIFCNILIYLAVEGFKNAKHDLARYLALFFGVAVFILSGFEHCVADMFYFAMARSWTLDTLLRLIVITAGNMVGALIWPLLRRAAR